jgi:chromate reductase, NAD(P)H dehydrogenase (quinone)
LLEICDISRFPLFNEDREAELPEDVKEFKMKIRDADVILFAAPEYNYSISAIMNNAIEWGNRPEGDNAWDVQTRCHHQRLCIPQRWGEGTVSS